MAQESLGLYKILVNYNTHLKKKEKPRFILAYRKFLQKDQSRHEIQWIY